jgi:hypothetical protein
LLNDTELKEILLCVTNLIQVLGSRDVALDGRHTPALYSRFISSLLKEYCPKAYLPMVQDTLASSHHGGNSPRSSDGHEPQTDAYYSSWPDVSSVADSHSTPEHISMTPGMVYQRHGDPEMDFSLNHFVRTVSQGMPQPVGAPDMRFMGASSNSSAWGAWSQGGGRMGQFNSSDMWRA